MLINRGKTVSALLFFLVIERDIVAHNVHCTVIRLTEMNMSESCVAKIGPDYCIT